MTIACGMIGCPDWVSILGLRPLMREAWTTRERTTTGTGGGEVARGGEGATAGERAGGAPRVWTRPPVCGCWMRRRVAVGWVGRRQSVERAGCGAPEARTARVASGTFPVVSRDRRKCVDLTW